MTSTPATTNTVVAAHGISVHYGTRIAVQDVDLTLHSGEITGLIGRNGSGKSTLFKTLMRELHPSHGTVEVTGNIAYVPQSENIDWNFPLTVAQVVMMGRYGHMNALRIPRAADREAVAKALERTDLTDLASRQIGELSGGQKKRVFVARGLAQGAQILLLDEPFAGVDRVSESTIRRLLHELAEAGAAILISTHDLQSVPKLCDRVTLLNRRVVAEGTPDDVLTTDNLIAAFGADV